jgi:hypothetical protein
MLSVHIPYCYNNMMSTEVSSSSSSSSSSTPMSTPTTITTTITNDSDNDNNNDNNNNNNNNNNNDKDTDNVNVTKGWTQTQVSLLNIRLQRRVFARSGVLGYNVDKTKRIATVYKRSTCNLTAVQVKAALSLPFIQDININIEVIAIPDNITLNKHIDKGNDNDNDDKKPSNNLSICFKCLNEAVDNTDEKRTIVNKGTIRQCVECKKYACEKHYNVCCDCDDVYCEDCYTSDDQCTSCYDLVCESCRVCCIRCDDRKCSDCVHHHESCLHPVCEECESDHEATCKLISASDEDNDDDEEEGSNTDKDIKEDETNNTNTTTTTTITKKENKKKLKQSSSLPPPSPPRVKNVKQTTKRTASQAKISKKKPTKSIKKVRVMLPHTTDK